MGMVISGVGDARETRAAFRYLHLHTIRKNLLIPELRFFMEVVLEFQSTPVHVGGHSRDFIMCWLRWGCNPPHPLCIVRNTRPRYQSLLLRETGYCTVPYRRLEEIFLLFTFYSMKSHHQNLHLNHVPLSTVERGDYELHRTWLGLLPQTVIFLFLAFTSRRSS